MFPIWEGLLFRALTIAACVVALSGCGQPSEVAISDAWVRLPAAPGRPAGGYFTIRGGATDQTLVRVSSPAAGRIELHETMRSGPGMTMVPIASLKVPAGATIAFAPGGKHLMLFDLRQAAPAKPIPLTFTFASGRDLTVEARAVAAGDPAPDAK